MSTSEIQGLTGGHTIYLYPLPITLDWQKSSFRLFGTMSRKNSMDILSTLYFPSEESVGKVQHYCHQISAHTKKESDRLKTG